MTRLRSTLLLAVIAGALSGGLGCMVPAARYEEARSATAVEREATHRARTELASVSARLDRVQASLAERERKLEQLEEGLAEAKLSTDVASSERDTALLLLAQMQLDLGRTGEHLRLFAGEKQQLAAALAAAQVRAKKIAACEQAAADNAAVVRDVALLLHEPVATGEIELEVAEGRPLLRVPAVELTGEAVQPLGRRVLAAVARVTQLHRDARVRVVEVNGAGSDAESAARLRRIADQLGALGMSAGRIELAPKPAAPGAGGTPTLELTVYVVASDDASAPAPAEPATDPAETEPTVEPPPAPEG